jgi:hypothetical protein
LSGYLDVDIGVRHSLWIDLKPTTEFVTAVVPRRSQTPDHYFQAVIGAKPFSPVLWRYLQLFEKHYTGVDIVTKGLLGVVLLKRAYDDVTVVVPSDTDNDTDAATEAASLRSKTELYQEMLFDRQLFPNIHPAPTWGTRTVCHFLVVAEANNDENVEVTIPSSNKKKKKKDGGDMKYHVPLLSRIPVSRMCKEKGGKMDGKKIQSIKWWNRE